MQNELEQLMKGKEALCQKLLAGILEQFLTPAFGVVPRKELELLVIKALEELGYISKEPRLYDLVAKLRVTRAKARSLIYEQDLRRLDANTLDMRVKEALKRPLLQKQGELYVLEMENPLVLDHLRSKLRELGHASDESFSPSIVKMTLEGVSALIEHYIDEKQRKSIKAILVKAGAPNTSLQGLIKATIKAVAKKVADKSGEALVDKTSEFLSPLVDGVVGKLKIVIEEILKEEDPKEGNKA